MNSDLWVGAATTLAGAALAGLISLGVNRQQMRDARAQRAEDDQRAKDRRSDDRRFTAYVEFAARARSYRDAIRGPTVAAASPARKDAIDLLAQATGPPSAIVFLVTESQWTHTACGDILDKIGEAQTALHRPDGDWSGDVWLKRNGELGEFLRQFQVAARDELEVAGIDSSVILGSGGDDQGGGHKRDLGGRDDIEGQ